MISIHAQQTVTLTDNNITQTYRQPKLATL